MKKFYGVLLLLLFYNVCIGQAGSLDLNFGNQGIVKTHVGSQSLTYYYASVLQPDGKIVVAGFTMSNGNYDFAVARYRPEGILDATFSDDGVLIIEFGPGEDMAFALALQSDGKIIVGGFAYNGSNQDFAIARINADGTLDNSFSGDGKMMHDLANHADQIFDVKIQADGKIVAAGYSDVGNDNWDFAVTRYNPDGTPDNGFSSDGKQFTDFGSPKDFAAAVLLLPANKILAVGSYNYYENGDIAFARYNADGLPDASFHGTGLLTIDLTGFREITSSAVLQNDGKIVVSADTWTFNQGTDFGVARFNMDGSLDNTFSGDGKMIFDLGSTSESPTSIAIQPDGKLIIGGYGVGVVSNNNDFRIARLNSDGSLDNSFSGDGKLTMDFGQGEDLIEDLLLEGNHVLAIGRTAYFGTAGILAAFLINDPVAASIACPSDRVTATEPDQCSAVINNIDPILSVNSTPVDYILTGATVWNGTGYVSGFRFPSGNTTVTYRLTNEPTKFCSFILTVNDTELPRAEYPFQQSFCFNTSNNYTLPALHVTDNCGLRNIQFSISGATSRIGFGTDPSGQFNIGTSTIDWIVADISGNTMNVKSIVNVGSSLNVTIPDAYTLPQGSQANTVYRGYSPASFITLQAIPSGGNGIYSTQWSDGFRANWNTVQPTMPTTYTVTVTDLSGCKAIASKTIEVTDVRCGEQRNKVQICQQTSTGPQLLCVDFWNVPNYLANGAFLHHCSSELLTRTQSIKVKLQKADVLDVYPNPSPQEFKLRIYSSSNEPGQLIIRDQIGRVIETLRFKPNQFILVGKNYKAGIYFAELRLGDKKYNSKLIRQ